MECSGGSGPPRKLDSARASHSSAMVRLLIQWARVRRRDQHCPRDRLKLMSSGCGKTAMITSRANEYGKRGFAALPFRLSSAPATPISTFRRLPLCSLPLASTFSATIVADRRVLPSSLSARGVLRNLKPVLRLALEESRTTTSRGAPFHFPLVLPLSVDQNE